MKALDYNLVMKRTDKFYEAYSAFCQTVTNPIRLKIIESLGSDKLNVSELQEKVEVSMSNLSNHLSPLYKLGVLDREKKGNFTYYFLADGEILDIILKMGGFMDKINQLKHNDLNG